LAGNSLLTLAFEILTSNKMIANSKSKSDLVHTLASSSGYTGIAGDVFGDTKKIGKPTRGDKKKGKATIIKNLGINKAIEFSYQLADGITEKLKKRYGTRADRLVDSVNFLLRRDH